MIIVIISTIISDR